MTTDPDAHIAGLLANMEARRALPDLARRVRYQQRIIAFLDVLGWKELVAESVRSRVAMRHLAGLQLWGALDQSLTESLARRGEHVVTHFSDSIVLSWLAPRRPQDRIRLVLDTAVLVRNYFLNRVFVRGGLTRGRLVHGKNVVFGPALIDAHELESKHARYPRVIVAEALAKALFADFKAVQAKVPLIRRDTDGTVFLDFLSLGREDIRWPNFMSEVRSHLLECRAQTRKPRIREKYDWLVRYFNTVRLEARLREVRPIEP